MKERRGLTLVELLVALVILFIVMWIGYNNFQKWKIRYSLESDVQKIYSEIQRVRMKAFTQKLKVLITCRGKKLIFVEENGTGNATTSFELSNPFIIDSVYGKFEIDENGLFSKTGKLKYAGTYNVSPKFDCVIVSRNRVRLGKCR